MCLKNLNRLKNETAFKLTAWYAGMLTLSIVLIYTLSYFFIYKKIYYIYQDLVKTKAFDYQEISKVIPEKDLINKMKFDAIINDFQGFYIIITDPRRNILHINYPDLNSGEFEKQNSKDIFSCDSFYNQSFPLKSGNIFYIGFNKPQTLNFVEDFSQNILFIIIPVLLSGLIGGGIMARKATKPSRDLLRAVENVEKGNIKTRVSVTESNSELNQLAVKINSMLQRIEALIEGLKNTLDNLAHDIRTPLTRIRASIEKNILIPDEKKMRESLLDCAEEANIILDMLNTLTDISEAETGIMNLNKSNINLKDLTTALCDIFSFEAEDNEIEIIDNIPDDFKVFCDKNRMIQILSNLIENAVKYSDKNGKVILEALQEDENRLIIVKDNGPGIPQKDINNIFDKLYRVDKSRSKKGSGLGLAIVKAIVTAHGWEISVKSIENKGSEFIIEIPRRKNMQ